MNSKHAINKTDEIENQFDNREPPATPCCGRYSSRTSILPLHPLPRTIRSQATAQDSENTNAPTEEDALCWLSFSLRTPAAVAVAV